MQENLDTLYGAVEDGALAIALPKFVRTPSEALRAEECTHRSRRAAMAPTIAARTVRLAGDEPARAPALHPLLSTNVSPQPTRRGLDPRFAHGLEVLPARVGRWREDRLDRLVLAKR